ncbi:MAG: hypothetical protein BGO00_09435 [Alphaproteobacteria bacterium 62-8]|nr:MAG: hypothetical protein BGO00_09435 [Alphaproteobacteria bacterium 62-8]
MRHRSRHGGGGGSAERSRYSPFAFALALEFSTRAGPFAALCAAKTGTIRDAPTRVITKS